MNSPVASTSVLIRGPEITVGSIFRRAAISGSSAPTALAHNTMARSPLLTARAIGTVVPQVSARMNPTADMARPSRMPVRDSCQNTFSTSRQSTSPTARARMMVAVVWEPALPPVPMSKGTKKAKATSAVSSGSK